MALQKTFKVPGGYEANYIRWNYTEENNRLLRKATIWFALYRDRAAMDSGEPPIMPQAVHLRLEGEKYDQYLSPAALAAAKANGEDEIAIYYRAAKTEPVDMLKGSGPLLADAVNV
jgi:hypothetical protein